MRAGWSRTLFGQTALLIGASLMVFSATAWAALVWTAVIPAARTAGHVVAEKAIAAADASVKGQPLPSEVSIQPVTGPRSGYEPGRVYFSFYLSRLRRQLQTELPGARILISRSVMPSQIWIQLPRLPDRWFVVTWHLASPGTPAAAMGVLLTSALLVLAGGGMFARRLTAPLADLASAASRIGEGERVELDTGSGPAEVRALAAAFASMSNRLAKHEEQRELMLAGLSHDLRSPLARLRVAVELLDSRDAELAGHMTVEIEDIDRMVGQFLHYVRAGYRETLIEACADDITRESVAHFGNSERLRLALDSAEPRLLAAESVQHILLNLVNNALDHGRPPVTVSTSLTSDELRISVADHGPGLSPDEWNEALEPFRRIRPVPDDGHTGLGLALIHRLVEALRGTLTARRTREGFLIEVILPAVPIAGHSHTAHQ